MLIGLSHLAKGATLAPQLHCASPGAQLRRFRTNNWRWRNRRCSAPEASGAPELAPVEMSTARQELGSAEKATADGMAQPARQWAEKPT